MTTCPCCSQKPFAECCEPYLLGAQKPPTPEALMRSRYTAYTLANIPYIKKTMRGQALRNFDEMEAKLWAKRVHWLALEVLNSHMKSAAEAYVEFKARFMDRGEMCTIHENSKFLRKLGQWFYVDGTQNPS